jgi:hypothetical protein
LLEQRNTVSDAENPTAKKILSLKLKNFFRKVEEFAP